MLPEQLPEPVSTDRVPTRDLHPPTAVPALSPFSLRTLASALDRLMAFHAERGGRLVELPQLERVELTPDGKVSAHARSGEFHFRLVLRHTEWVLD